MAPNDKQKQIAIDYFNFLKDTMDKEGKEMLSPRLYDDIYVPESNFSTKFFKIIDVYIDVSPFTSNDGIKMDRMLIRNGKLNHQAKYSDSELKNIEQTWEPFGLHIGEFETHITINGKMTKIVVKGFYKTKERTYPAYDAYARAKLEDFTSPETFDSFKDLYNFTKL